MKLTISAIAGFAGILSVTNSFAGCGSTSCEETRTCAGNSDGQAGDGGGDGSVDGGTFSFEASPSSVTVQVGQSAVIDISLTRVGKPADVTIDAAGLPSGVSMAPITIKAQAAVGQAELVAALVAQQGDADIVLNARAGTELHSKTVHLLVRGASGSIDKSFGNNGVVTPGWTLETPPIGPVLFSSGRVAVIGSFGQISDFRIAKFLETGALDTSFGGSGIVTYPSTDGLGHQAFAASLTAQETLRIAGTTGLNAGLFELGVTNTLTKVWDFSGSAGAFHSVVSLPAGDLIAGGVDQSSTPVAYVQRFGPDGKPDLAWADASIKKLLTTATNVAVRSLAAKKDGGTLALVTEFSGTATPAPSSYVAWLTASGAPADFGNSGIRDLDLASGEDGRGIFERANGGILVGGTTGGSWFLIQLDTTGAYDTTFNGSGIAIAQNSEEDLSAMLIDAKDRILIAGRSGGAWYVRRFDPVGMPDGTFGDAGLARIVGADRPWGLAIQPDERILVGTSSNSGPPYSVNVYRLWP